MRKVITIDDVFDRLILLKERNSVMVERKDMSLDREIKLSPPICKSCSLCRINEEADNTMCMKILSIFGHKTLDEKLLRHNIKRQRSKSARFVRNLMLKSLSIIETSGFQAEDLEKLSLEQLHQLKKSFTKKVAEKIKEQEQETGAKESEIKSRMEMMSDIRDIEHDAKNVLKPCVNVLADSDDMARVLLLN